MKRMSCIFSGLTQYDCPSDDRVMLLSRDDVRSMMSEAFMSEMMMRVIDEDTAGPDTTDTIIAVPYERILTYDIL